MKRFISAIMTVILILSVCFTLCSCGQKASPVEDFEYEFENGEVTITGYIGSDLKVVIPSVIEDRPVTVIGKKAFKGYDLKAVVIPEGVVEIKREAFYGCECLESITVPDSLQKVGAYAFSENLWLNNQPEGVIYIGNVVVGYKGEPREHSTNNAHTVEIYIKDGTKSIVDDALNYSAIRDVHLPDSITYIGEDAFDERFLTLYGKEGSIVKSYAYDNNVKFVAE